MEQVYKLTQLSVESGFLGGIAIAVGLTLCFFGKRFFKPFLAMIGMACGAIVGFVGMSVASQLVEIPNLKMTTYLVAVVLGILASLIFMAGWRYGVYSAAGLGGYSLTVYLLSFKAGGLVENEFGRSTCLIVGVLAAEVAAYFLEDLVLVAASCITGSLMATVGADCYLNTGFGAHIYDQAIKRTFVLPELTNSICKMMATTAGLAVLGAVVQLLAPSKGFGRAH